MDRTATKRQFRVLCIYCDGSQMRLHHVWMRPSIRLSRRRRVARLPARSRSSNVISECSPLRCAFRRWRRVRIVPRGWRRRRRKAWLLRRRWLCDGRDVHAQEALFLFPFGGNTMERGNRKHLKGNGPGLKGTSTRMDRRNQARMASRRGKERVGFCVLVGGWSRVVRRERIMCARPRDGKTCVSSGQGTRSNRTVHEHGQRNDASAALRAQATATAAHSTRSVPAKFEVHAQGTPRCRNARPVTSKGSPCRARTPVTTWIQSHVLPFLSLRRTFPFELLHAQFQDACTVAPSSRSDRAGVG